MTLDNKTKGSRGDVPMWTRSGFIVHFIVHNLIRPKQIMTLFPVARPGHFFPNSETFFWSQMYTNGGNAMCASALSES